MPAPELVALQAQIDELRGILRKKQNRRHGRPMIALRLSEHDLAALENEAARRGICRTDLIRIALAPVIGREIPIKRDIPKNFRTRRIAQDAARKNTAAGLDQTAAGYRPSKAMIASALARGVTPLLPEPARNSPLRAPVAVPIVPKPSR